jgi:rubrerythrin
LDKQNRKANLKNAFAELSIGFHMNFTEKDLIKFFREQAKLEEEIVESVDKSLVTIKNSVVEAILKGMALDSSKHAAIYKAAENIVKVAPALTESEFNELKKVAKWHVENESKVIVRLEDAVKKTENKRIKFLLQAILADEKRHHQLLEAIVETIVKGETITNDEWWDMLWKNVPFHGSPGG